MRSLPRRGSSEGDNPRRRCCVDDEAWNEAPAARAVDFQAPREDGSDDRGQLLQVIGRVRPAEGDGDDHQSVEPFPFGRDAF